MAVTLMGVGERRRVTRIRGKDEVIRHLQDLGFAPGSEVEVLGEHAGGMILLVRGVRVALDRRLACRIMVA